MVSGLAPEHAPDLLGWCFDCLEKGASGFDEGFAGGRVVGLESFG